MIPLALAAMVVSVGVLYASSKSTRRRYARTRYVVPFVGMQGYRWPLRDQFPNEASFGSALEQLQYPVPGFGPGEDIAADWSVKEIPGIISAFQADYNTVDAAFNGAIGQVAPSGLIDDHTITAILDAFVYEDSMGFEWPMVIEAARQQGGVT